MRLDIYATKDLGEASALYTKGVTFVGIEKQGSICFFGFEDKIKCEELAQLFWAQKLKVDAKMYHDALRTLKDRIFAKV